MRAIPEASGHHLISIKAFHDVRWFSRHFGMQALVRKCDVLFEYCRKQRTRDSKAVFCAAKVESMQVKAALFVLKDILTEPADLSKTFQKSVSITPQAVADSRDVQLAFAT